MDKLILREIAKRWCKSILFANEAGVSFSETLLTDDEIDYIQNECLKIGNRITNLDYTQDVMELVKEYYE